MESILDTLNVVGTAAFVDVIRVSHAQRWVRMARPDTAQIAQMHALDAEATKRAIRATYLAEAPAARESLRSSFGQSQSMRCYDCRERGHRAQDCRFGTKESRYTGPFSGQDRN